MRYTIFYSINSFMVYYSVRITFNKTTIIDLLFKTISYNLGFAIQFIVYCSYTGLPKRKYKEFQLIAQPPSCLKTLLFINILIVSKLYLFIIANSMIFSIFTL